MALFQSGQFGLEFRVFGLQTPGGATPLATAGTLDRAWMPANRLEAVSPHTLPSPNLPILVLANQPVNGGGAFVSGLTRTIALVVGAITLTAGAPSVSAQTRPATRAAVKTLQASAPSMSSPKRLVMTRLHIPQLRTKAQVGPAYSVRFSPLRDEVRSIVFAAVSTGTSTLTTTAHAAAASTRTATILPPSTIFHPNAPSAAAATRTVATAAGASVRTAAAAVLSAPALPVVITVPRFVRYHSPFARSTHQQGPAFAIRLEVLPQTAHRVLPVSAASAAAQTRSVYLLPIRVQAAIFSARTRPARTLVLMRTVYHLPQVRTKIQNGPAYTARFDTHRLFLNRTLMVAPVTVTAAAPMAMVRPLTVRGVGTLAASAPHARVQVPIQTRYHLPQIRTRRQQGPAYAMRLDTRRPPSLVQSLPVGRPLLAAAIRVAHLNKGTSTRTPSPASTASPPRAAALTGGPVSVPAARGTAAAAARSIHISSARTIPVAAASLVTVAPALSALRRTASAGTAGAAMAAPAATITAAVTLHSATTALSFQSASVTLAVGPITRNASPLTLAAAAAVAAMHPVLSLPASLVTVGTQARAAARVIAPPPLLAGSVTVHAQAPRAFSRDVPQTLQAAAAVATAHARKVHLTRHELHGARVLGENEPYAKLGREGQPNALVGARGQPKARLL